jgi:hypothetical protein
LVLFICVQIARNIEEEMMNEFTAIRPEDVLSDAADSTFFGSLEVRKGTIGAFVANVKHLEQLAPADPHREAVQAQLLTLATALRAIGVFDVFTPRSPDLAEILAREVPPQ